jgi:TPR repeat protein
MRAAKSNSLGALRRATVAAGLTLNLLCGSGMGGAAVLNLGIGVGLSLVTTATCWASLDAAMQAWAAGDYRGSAKLLKPMADSGDPEASFNLGLYYFQGLGGDRNYPEAARLFRIAAERGHVMAANNLAAMHMEGRGVLPDPAEAWFWFATVAHRGDQAAGVLRDMASSKMTPVQVELARKRFNAWVDEHDTPWWKRVYRSLTK